MEHKTISPIQPGFYSRHGDIEEFMARRCGSDFLRYRQLWHNPELEHPSHPLCLLIEVIDACDMRCRTCFRNFIKNRGTQARLPLDAFKNILDQAEELGVSSISLPNGEPMLHPDILAMLNYLSTKNFQEALVYTNGRLFGPAVRKEILRCANTMPVRLHVSLDAATSETYRKARGGDLREVSSNIEAFLAERESIRARPPLLWVSFLIKDENAHEAEEFYQLWYEKADIIEFQQMLTPNIFHELRHDVMPSRSVCDEPFKRMMILADGTICGCCCLQFRHQQIGHIRETTLAEAWVGDRMANLRRQLQQHTLSLSCRNCLALGEGII